MLKIIFSGIIGTLAIVLFFIFIIYEQTVNKSNWPEGTAATPSPLGRARAALVALRNFAFAPLEEAVTKVIMPGPLLQLSSIGIISYENPLTRAGVIATTNEERLRADLPPLRENPKLNEAARLRLEDMFKKQYFAHTSPAGGGVATAVTATGYAYIVVGENLALGEFKNDRAVVTAWLHSPAHKANMLARRYADIGVAVDEGDYKGARARLAVQIFGTPITACPVPNEGLRKNIYANKSRIDRLEPSLTFLKKKIAKESPLAAGLAADIKSYNRRAAEFNTLIQTTQEAIDEYNRETRLFNSCASEK